MRIFNFRPIIKSLKRGIRVTRPLLHHRSGTFRSHYFTALTIDYLCANTAIHRYGREEGEMVERKILDEELLRTPVNLVWDHVLMLPIVGLLDSMRTQNIMEIALAKIQETRARVLIIDIMGVAVMDEAVAEHIIKITRAAKLMGCECILTGVSPDIARNIVSRGLDLGDLRTHATIRDGLEMAFRVLGLEVRKSEG
nr:STAS domain-containing protein [Candidatus Solincola tengchongensis]